MKYLVEVYVDWCPLNRNLYMFSNEVSIIIMYVLSA